VEIGGFIAHIIFVFREPLINTTGIEKLLKKGEEIGEILL